MFSSLIIALFCFLPAFAAPFPFANVPNRLPENERYDVGRLAEVYYDSRQARTLSDAERFERLVAVLESMDPQPYSNCFRDLFEENRLEEFQTLYPLIQFDDVDPFNLYLLLECVDEKVPFAEYMLSQNLDLELFIDKTTEDLKGYTCPDDAVDVIEWLAERNAFIATRKPSFYQALIGSTLENFELDKEGRLELVQRLVDLGATIDNRVIYDANDVMSDFGNPGHVVDIFEWLAEVNDFVASRKANIYREWILCLLRQNGNISNEKCIKLIRRLAELGARIDDEVQNEVRVKFPNEEELHEHLHILSFGPDIKEPDCD